MSVKNRFFASLTSSNYAVKAKRANVVNEAAKAEYTQVILGLEAQKRDIENKIFNLEDIGPSQTTSLRVTDSQFDAKGWVAAQQELRLELLVIKEQLKVAQEAYDYYFVETEDFEDAPRKGKKQVAQEDEDGLPTA